MEQTADSSRTGVEPGYGWFGGEYKPVWRVYVNGHQVGVWTKSQWARRDLREKLRAARHAARKARR